MISREFWNGSKVSFAIALDVDERIYVQSFIQFDSCDLNKRPKFLPYAKA